MATLPVRNTANPCSLSERAFAQSPLIRCSMPAARWARPTVVRMLRRLGEPDRLGGVLLGLGESAELGEAQDEPAAIVDRWRGGGAEILVDPLGGQDREIVGGQLDDPLVLAPKVVRLLEVRRPEDAESQVPEASGDVQRAVAAHERLVQLSEQRVEIRHRRADSPSLAIVVQPVGERLGLAQPLQRRVGPRRAGSARAAARVGSRGPASAWTGSRGARSSASSACSNQRRASGSADRVAALQPGLPQIVDRLLP